MSSQWSERARAAVLAAVATMGGRIWPSGLGFDLRGWEYFAGEVGGKGWHALYRGGRRQRAAYGLTPAQAKDNAIGLERLTSGRAL